MRLRSLLECVVSDLASLLVNLCFRGIKEILRLLLERGVSDLASFLVNFCFAGDLSLFEDISFSAMAVTVVRGNWSADLT